MDISFSARTDVGRVRENNEDNFLVDRKMRLYVVADGMGGHAAGAVASATAVNVVREILVAQKPLMASYEADRSQEQRKQILKVMGSACRQACHRIHQRGLRNPSERGMGTTLSVLMLLADRAFIAHVGDSRVYLLRDGAVHQLTDDHSLLADMVKHGRIRSANEVDPRFRNAVTRAVGVHETVEVDTLDLHVLPGDRFLLCSDGLTGYADGPLLEQMMSKHKDEDELCDALILHANQAGGVDNITAVVATVRDAPLAEPEKVRLVLRALRGLTLFRYLSYAELLRIMNIAEERHVKKDETVFAKGDTGLDAYVILSGQIQVQTSNVVVAVLDPGRHFGEMGLVDEKPRMADAFATEDSWLQVIPRSAFYDMMRKNPQLAVKLLWSFIKAMTARLRLTTNELTLTKQLFHAVSPEDFGRMPQEWLAPDDMGTRPPRGDVSIAEPMDDLPPRPTGRQTDPYAKVPALP
ncbi:MAG: serine/threonine protein phosphatase PrpC/CRP-like cAMP-binding protein, partial [Myxococcota bacterium]